jgi:uncharacterized protein
MMRSCTLVLFAAFFAYAAGAQSVPKAVYTDPLADAAHPAKMEVLHIPTHGLKINGIIYEAAGEGPHPTLVLCHGLPGNEKNADLAQAVRRDGWNAVMFNYRGSWGSPGNFRFAQNVEDAEAVLEYLRDPANAQKLNVDTQRLVLLGHSMGGWVTVNVAARDHHLAGAILISAADMASIGARMSHEDLVKFMTDNMESLAGVTPQTMADDDRSVGKSYTFAANAENLTSVPLLVLTANDGLAPAADELAYQIEIQGGHQLTKIHVATDHSWSDHRIALETIVIGWLNSLGR